jgi:nucleotide-binding universal stress UspA family protein
MPTPSSASRPRPVVAAVDGAESGLHAVRYGVDEAVRRGTWLLLVHVTPSYVPMPPLREPPWLEETGHSMLRHAADWAREAAPGLEVHADLMTGSTTRSLVRVSGDAELLVLGGSRPSGRHWIWTGSTTTGVAARAECPVIALPQEWVPGSRGRVVVGFKSEDHAEELLAAGFEAAARLRAELVVLHAWRLPGAYDDIVVERVDREAWRERTLATLTPLLEAPRGRYPDLTVHVQVEHAHPAQALALASRDADLVVLVRPQHGSAIGHLGSVARAVLRHADCPVEVLPAVELPARAESSASREAGVAAT